MSERPADRVRVYVNGKAGKRRVVEGRIMKFNSTTVWVEIPGGRGKDPGIVKRRLDRDICCNACEEPGTVFWRKEIPLPVDPVSRIQTYELGALQVHCERHAPDER